LFVSFPPKIAPVVVARTVKSILAIAVFRQFPSLKRKRFWGSGLWSRGTYYGSAGTVSGATIMRYIEQQKEA
jgi:putative transposase